MWSRHEWHHEREQGALPATPKHTRLGLIGFVLAVAIIGYAIFYAVITKM